MWEVIVLIPDHCLSIYFLYVIYAMQPTETVEHFILQCGMME